MSAFQFLFFRTRTVTENISTLPNTCFKYTNNALDTNKDIYQIIKNLDHSEAHDHDMIGIHMLKICGISTCKPLEAIFENYLKFGQISFRMLKGKCCSHYWER